MNECVNLTRAQWKCICTQYCTCWVRHNWRKITHKTNMTYVATPGHENSMALPAYHYKSAFKFDSRTETTAIEFFLRLLPDINSNKSREQCVDRFIRNSHMLHWSKWTGLMQGLVWIYSEGHNQDSIVSEAELAAVGAGIAVAHKSINRYSIDSYKKQWAIFGTDVPVIRALITCTLWSLNRTSLHFEKSDIMLQQ